MMIHIIPPPINLAQAYRSHLWYKLKDANYSVDFVGSRYTGLDVNPYFDGDNEGYPGYTTFQISTMVYELLEKNQADIILLHIGSNDIWIPNNENVNMLGLSTLLDEIDRYEKDYNHHIKVVLSKIIDRTWHPSFTSIFNNKLEELVHQRMNDDIDLIDMQFGAKLRYDYSDFQDYTHPNNIGYEKMSTVWFEALVPLLKNHTPITSEDNVITLEDTPIDIAVLVNDTDPDGDILIVKSCSTPKHGTVTISSPEVTYVSDPNYAGEDSFYCTISDGNGADVNGTVNVTILPVNDIPKVADDTNTTNENMAIDLDVMANDLDIV